MLINPFVFGGGSALADPFFSGDFGNRLYAGVTTFPVVKYHAASDRTYCAWIAQMPAQTVKITYWDHTSEAWGPIKAIDTTTLENNDHGVPSLEILSDGRLVIFAGSHNSDLSWWVSAQSGGVPDITSWSRQGAFTALDYSYAKPLNIDSGGGAGTLYLIVRHYDGAGNYPLYIQAASYTSGGSVVFGAATEIVDLDGGSGDRVYAGEVRNDGSGNLEFFATRADSGDTVRKDIFYFKYMTATGAVENIDGSTSTASGSLPVDRTNAEANYREFTSPGSNITGLVSWCRIGSDLHILYGNDTAGFDIEHNRYSGGSWGTAATVGQVNYLGGNGYVSEWCLVPNGSNVEAWYPTGNTNSWTARGGDKMVRRVWSGGSFGSEETIAESDGSYALNNPTAVEGAQASFRVAFSEITQGSNAVDAGMLKRYAYGDGGALAAISLTDEYYQQTCLLLNFNGTDGATSYSDESPWVRHPVTFFGNAQLDTAQKKFGSASLLLDGTGDYLTVAATRLDEITSGHEFKLTGDTIEVFFRLNETGRAQVLMATREDQGGGVTHGFQFLVAPTNVLRVLLWSGTNTFLLDGVTTLTTGVWYYATLKRDGDTVSLTLDTSSEASGSLSAASVTPAEGGNLNIGRDPTATTRNFNGWIDSIRWTKRILRDVSTVPTVEFPAG